MKYWDVQILFQEVPGEISICFTIMGCDLNCKGCHSTHLWSKNKGHLLSNIEFANILEKYKDFASCVLFMGGEWHQKELIEKLDIALKMGFSTCLYTGRASIDKKITAKLTWLKYGPWKEELGGLDCPKTNQRFIQVKEHKTLNHLFQKN